MLTMATDIEQQPISDVVEDNPLQYKFHEGNSADKGFKWTLLLGRCIGCIPHSFSFLPKGIYLTFYWRSFACAHTSILAFLGICLVLPQFWWGFTHIGSYPTILDEMQGFQGPICQSVLTFVPMYMIKSSRKLLRLLNNWSLTMKKIKLTTEDNNFPRFCLTISVIVLGMAVTENLLCDFYLIDKRANELDGIGLIEKLYKIEGMLLFHVVPHFSDFTSLLVIYFDKFGTFCWNFGDIFVIILCRALSYKYKQFNDELKQYYYNDWVLVKTVKQIKQNQGQGTDSDCISNEGEGRWNDIRDKLFALIDLTIEVTQFVAPLVLACFGCSLFLIILNSLRCIYEGVDNSAYVYVSTIQFAMRMILVTYHASQVYHSTEQIQQTIERFSDKIFCPAASRLEKMLARHPVGVTIFGAIVITRKFFITILSFLFTTEIVVLQAMSASMQQKKVDIL